MTDILSDADERAAQLMVGRIVGKNEFCERFVAAMIKSVGTKFADGDSIEAYAREVAPSYFEEQFVDDPTTTPEEWAACDISYWED